MFIRLLALSLLTNTALLAAGGDLPSLPIFFVPGTPDAPFQVRGSGLTASFATEGVVFRMGSASVHMTFDGANPQARLQGGEALPGRVNFLRGGRDRWRVGVPVYASITYRDLYPGIDMTYGSNGRNLKSEYVVAPGADLSQIWVRYAEVTTVRVDPDGSLVLDVDGQELREKAPVAYQDRNGHRTPVAARYSLSPGGAVGFIVNAYDSTLPLIIDPVIVFSTLLGGSSADSALAMAVDPTGAVYLTGFTSSSDFPKLNPEQSLIGGSNDAFVAKLNAAGTALVYCTYLGGTGDDRAYGIAVDSSGSAYITGSTASKNFPLHNALQTKLNGTKNVFVSKLNAAGNALVFSTYLGGAGSDTGYGIALDTGGNPYIVGDTTSSTFPATGYQKSYRGSQDAFVASLSTDGSRLLYSTFLGGAGTDHGAGIAVDPAGGAYVTGSTSSADFPTASPFQPSNAGGQDAFVARLSPGGATLIFSTYLGGSGGSASYPEQGQGIALDGPGNVYVAGMTSSPNFPMFQPLQASLNGWEDAFVVKLTSAGWPVYSTYLGGSGSDYANAIAVDSTGNAYVTGYTYSTDLPVVNALQPAIAIPGDVDAFVAILNAGGASLSYLSYLGGTASDTGAAVALDPSGGIYVAGWTLSTNFPLLHPLQSVNGGNYGAYVLKMQQLALRIACTHSGSFTQGQTGTYTVTVTNTAAAASTTGLVMVTDVFSPDMALVSMTGTGWNCTGTTCTRSDTLAAGASYPSITVTAKALAGAVSPQQNTVTVAGGGDLVSHSAVDSTSILAGVTYTISGHIGVASVPVSLTGGQTASTVTDSSGNYALPGILSGGNYTVTPAAANYLFTPLSQSFTNLSSSQAANFSALQNLAQGKAATQTATYLTFNAGLAVDGNTDGNYNHGSLSVGNWGPNTWWQVDLGASNLVNTIAVWGRTDAWSNWLSDYWVFVSDTPFGAGDTPATLQGRAGTWSNHQTTWPAPVTFLAAGGAQGRYVRVQLTGSNYLDLAEVQVFGATAPTYTVSGQVTVSGTGAGVAGATVSLTGNQTTSTTTDSSGNYALSGVAGAAYTVTASLPPYVFTPGSQSIASLGSSQVVNFAGKPNLAQGKTATESSVYSTNTASFAVDGITDGNGLHGSISITNSTTNPWWQVDLGASTAVSSIIIWGRTDGTWSTMLSDYWVFVSDTPFGAADTPAILQSRAATWSNHQTIAPNPSTSILGSGAQGRYVRVQLTGSNYLEIAEVQVFGTVSAVYNISGRITASDTGAGVPGVTVSLTGTQTNSTTTDGSGTYVLSAVAGGTYTLTPSLAPYAFSPASQSVTNLSSGQAINFAAKTDLAQGQTATESSIYSGDTASLAIDGNTDGNGLHGSIAVTNYSANPWWQVDLGSSTAVSSIVVWARTDGAWSTCLSDYWVFVSDTPFNATDTPAMLQARASTWNNHQTAAPNPSTTISGTGAQGRYVRVQLTGTNYLEIAEVQIFGSVSTTYSIWGQVLSTTGTGLAGVTMILTGTQVMSATTDSSGNYLLSGVVAGGSYTLTSSLAPYVMTPASQMFPSLSSNQIVNFTSKADLAQGKTASESTTYATSTASLAADGNIDGNGYHGSIAITNYSANPWWQVDLGASTAMSAVVIWARTDGVWSSCLSDYWVFVSDTPFNPTDTPTTLKTRAGTWNNHQTAAPNPSTYIPSSVQGRYVRVQLTGTNYLEIAEVQVMGN